MQLNFKEWLKENHYDEAFRDYLPGKKTLGALTVGGAALWSQFAAPSYEEEPPQNRPGAIASIEDKTKVPIEIILSGDGPLSVDLTQYEVENANIKNVSIKTDAGYLTAGSLKLLINRNTIISQLKGAKGTNLDRTIGEGDPGQTIQVVNQIIKLKIKNRTFVVSPKKMNEKVAKIIDKDFGVTIDDGWITIRATGSITLGKEDQINP